MKKFLISIILLISISNIFAKNEVIDDEVIDWFQAAEINCRSNHNNKLNLIDDNFETILRPRLEHSNGWFYPTGSGNYQYLSWLGFNSAFNGYHLAQDMANPLGDPVYAIDYGQVLYSACVNGYGGPSGGSCGGALAIQHRAKDGTWFTALYGHLDNRISAGTVVYAGDIIGYSNNWNPPHVHFGVRLGYNPDPANWERGYTSNQSITYGFTNPITFLGNFQACKNGSSVTFRPNNSTPVHPNGSLIKKSNDSTVYLIRNGQKQGIVSADVLRNLYPNGGYDFKDIITIADDEFNNYPTGAAISSQLPTNGRTHSEGRLIRRATGGEVSIVTNNGTRRPFVSASVFQGLGYLWCNVVDATDSNYDSYPVGIPITGETTAQSITVTVQTNPIGRTFTVDGTTYSTTQTFNWTSGSNHTISTSTPQTNGSTRWIWSNWSNGGSISQTVSPTSNSTYTANFSTQYFLDMNTGTGGTVSPGSNWFNAGQQVQISATPNSGFTFSNWSGNGSGSYSGINNSALITMNSPITQNATFSQIPTCNYSIAPNNTTVSSNSGGSSFTVNTSSGCSWSATSNNSWITVSGSGSGSGTVTYFYQPNSGSARTGTISVGGQLFTISQNAGTTNVSRKEFDYDGDGKSDISVFRPSNGAWYIQRSNLGFYAVAFGQAGDLITPADFTGDGKTDVAVYRPNNGTWYILRSEDNTFYGIPFGTTGDIPVPEDFDGDGKADINVFRPSTGQWLRTNSSNNQFVATPFGQNGDVPTVGDYDGDGKADIGVWRPSNGVWYRLNSANGSFFAVAFGQTGDKVVPADYTGDGKTDIAVFRAGTWFILRSEDLTFYGIPFGLSTDVPSPGDYDGDGKADQAVYRNGQWFIQQSTSGFISIPFGLTADIPTESAFVR